MDQYISMFEHTPDYLYNYPEITFNENVFDNNSVYNLTIYFVNFFKCALKVSFSFTDNCPMIIKHCLIACYKKHILQHYPTNL